jgi:hypothetical protein
VTGCGFFREPSGAASRSSHRSPGGALCSEFVWAALDCPGYFGAAGPDYPKALLGRMTATLHSGMRAGERCIVMGWLIGKEGRKLHAGTALFGPGGDVRARAKQTWIVVG